MLVVSLFTEKQENVGDQLTVCDVFSGSEDVSNQTRLRAKDCLKSICLEVQTEEKVICFMNIFIKYHEFQCPDSVLFVIEELYQRGPVRIILILISIFRMQK